MSPAMEADISTSAAGPRTPAGTNLAVHLNGEPRDTTARTLANLVSEAGYGDAKVATAINGEFVAARLRESTALNPGDHIEIVAPRQGG
jgi:sulfur carrier protein